MEKINFPIHPYTASILQEVPEAQRALLPKTKNIPMRKYATSIDPRNYLSVYEYRVQDNWVIWDYHSGMVHLTGLWKAIGNSKADIVKLLESSPELEKHLKRIRGGYLKVQGTWISYDMAKLLASKFCYTIRYALVPLFGADFVDLCLKPHQRGFGMLRLHVTDADLKRRRRRRRRRSSATTTGPQTSRGRVNKPRLGPTPQTYAKRATFAGPPVSYPGPTNVQNTTTSPLSSPARDIRSQHLRSRSLSSAVDVAKLLPYPTMSKVCLLSIRYTGVQCSTAPSDYAFSRSGETQKRLPSISITENAAPRSEGLLSVLKAAQNLDSSIAVGLSRAVSANSTSSSVSPTYSHFSYAYSNYPVAEPPSYGLTASKYRSIPLTARVSSDLLHAVSKWFITVGFGNCYCLSCFCVCSHAFFTWSAFVGLVLFFCFFVYGVVLFILGFFFFSMLYWSFFFLWFCFLLLFFYIFLALCKDPGDQHSIFQLIYSVHIM